MTALETLIEDLKHANKLAQFSGRPEDYAALGKLAAGALPTILHALEEMNRRRIG